MNVKGGKEICIREIMDMCSYLFIDTPLGKECHKMKDTFFEKNIYKKAI